MQTVTKLEAAESQLATAIQIFFADGNDIAIHTLARASHEILDRLCAKKNIQRGVIEEGLKNVKPEFRKIVIDKVNKAKNYFKHGSTDLEEKLSWEPKVTEYFLWDATSLHQRFAGVSRKVPEIIIYMLWFRLHHEDLWINSEGGGGILDAILLNIKGELSCLSRQEFYEVSMMAWRKGGF